jgi:hypothetical protein
MTSHNRSSDPMTDVLATFRRPETSDFGNAWVGMEPTFQTKKSIRKWRKMAGTPEGEDRYFATGHMQRTQKRVAKEIKKRYEAWRKKDHPFAMFAQVELDDDLDQWKVRRQNLHFHWAKDRHEPFEVRFSLDPETFEYSIKPVPLAWFYDERFVGFLEEFLWKVPLKEGLVPSIAHGGAQFSISAKTFLGGSLMADDIAAKLNHPELAMWIMDWPNCDDRSFRCTKARFRAFRDVIKQYWAGAFHPKAIGTLTVENAYLDRGFEPSPQPPEWVMDTRTGPTGSPRDVFQTNFAFGRAVRLNAQNIHPGYWQSAHPTEEGYRPDQIMRYSEGNLNRLQIAGEYHVKSGKVLDPEHVVELDTPLDISLLYEECSWENRAQHGRTSARDFVEALLLDMHHAQYLQKHPHVKIRDSLLQDQLLFDAEETVGKYEPSLLDRLRTEARQLNLESSRQRVKSDWIEPETLFWAAWKVLPPKEKGAVAREVVAGFLERVREANSVDPRPAPDDDPMEWHRHRVPPMIWEAIEAAPGSSKPTDAVQKELNAWRARRDEYLKRRPVFSPVGDVPPWEEKA